MKKTIFLILLWALNFSVFSQPSGYKALDETQKKQTLSQISAATSQLTSLKVNFTQEKKSKAFTNPVVSSGTLSFKKSNFLRWAYTSPTSYSIILNENGAFYKNEKGSTKNKMIGEMAKLILRTVSGEGLTNSTDFTLSYYKGKDILVILLPKSKKMQEIYSRIEVYLNATYLATCVKMTEKNGDETVIKFTNHQKNVTFSENEFKE